MVPPLIVFRLIRYGPSINSVRLVRYGPFINNCQACQIVTRLYDGLAYLQNNKVDLGFTNC